MNKKIIQKGALLIAGGIVVAIFLYFDLHRFLTLDYIKAQQTTLQDLYGQTPVATLSTYILIYVVVAALSLPGAAVMTLAGGALFGLVAGTIAVSLASTIGATLACFVSRFILQDWVQSKFSDKLEPINKGVEREGAFYLFSVRLIPVFPFFVINLVMGLTKMPLRTFFWVSQLGMLPGTVVYVNAGEQLGQIESASGILSPSLIASFVILGVFPIAAKKIMQQVRKRYLAKEDPGVANSK